MKHVPALILLVFLTGCSVKPAVVGPSGGDAGGRDNEIYVVSHGWHTGFVLPAEEMRRRLPGLQRRFGSPAHMEFGWGDAGFYQADEVTSGVALRAVFWPSESVMHVVAVPDAVDERFAGDRMVKLCLTGSEFRSLMDFVESSFARDGRGEILGQGRGLYGDSQFYRGVGEYHLMNTCNTWTARGLRSAGTDISPAFKLTAGSVMQSIADTGCKTRSVR